MLLKFDYTQYLYIHALIWQLASYSYSYNLAINVAYDLKRNPHNSYPF